MPVDRPQAKGAQPVERSFRVDLRQRDLGHHGVLGEGGGAHEVAQRLSVQCEARRPVGQEAESLLIADRHAAVRPRAETVDALAALGSEQRDDVVARGHEAHARPHALDDARALVAEHARGVAGRVRARGGVQVGVADPARLEADERLAGLGSASSTSRTASGRPNSSSTAALTFIARSYV